MRKCLHGTMIFRTTTMAGTVFYDEMEVTPQYPFGFGMSYTEFSISDLQLDALNYTAGAPITATVQVANTGDVAGAEVVQLYLENEAAPVWMPNKELKGFEKVYLEPGGVETVTFTLGANELYYFDAALDRYEVAVGSYALRVGANSADLSEPVSFEITAGTPTPDFEVTRIYTFPRYPVPGDSLLLCALVKNQGTAVLTAEEPPVHVIFGGWHRSGGDRNTDGYVVDRRGHHAMRGGFGLYSSGTR